MLIPDDASARGGTKSTESVVARLLTEARSYDSLQAWRKVEAAVRILKCYRPVELDVCLPPNHEQCCRQKSLASANARIAAIKTAMQLAAACSRHSAVATAGGKVW